MIDNSHVVASALTGFVVDLTGAHAQSRRNRQPVRFKTIRVIHASVRLGIGFLNGTHIGGCRRTRQRDAALPLSLYPLRMTAHRLVATDIVHAIPLAVQNR